MSTNGDTGPQPARRFRFDGRRLPGLLGPRYSGRRFVTVALAVLAVIAGGLYLALRDWRARYRERREFGVREVATAVDRLEGLVPPGVAPAPWREAVRATHGMLVELSSSGATDRGTLERLRDDLRGRIAAARPETAVAVLTRIWGDMDRLGGPALSRAPRPRLLRLALAIDPLERVAPEGVSREDWGRALDETRAMLVELAASGRLDPSGREALRESWADRVARAGPDSAVAALGRVWDDAEARGGDVVGRHRRPALLDEARSGRVR